MQVLDKKTGFGSFTSIKRDTLLRGGVTFTPQAPLSLSVTVKTEDGASIKGAKIRLTAILGRSGVTAGEMTTDAIGLAKCSTIYTGGTYYLSASAEGYYNYSTSANLQVGSKDWTDTREIALRKAEYANGRVVDEAGKPVPSADVKIIAWTEVSARADADGAFRVQVPQGDDLGYDYVDGKQVPAKVVFKVTDPSTNQGAFLSIKREKLIKEGVTVTVHSTQPLTVLVKSEDGKPMPNVEVSAGAWFGSHGEGSRSYHTGKNGTVVCPDVYHGGTYQVYASLAGYYLPSPGPLPPVGSEKWKNCVELTMERANRTQKGKCVDKDGSPVKGAKIEAYVARSLTAASDAKGEFTLTGLPKSKTYVTAASGDLMGWAEVSKDTPEVVIKMSKQRQE